MLCPFCGHPDSRVVDSRTAGDTIRRRRECEGCERRYTTHERVELRLPEVQKKDGRREAYDREKVVMGIRIACRKRPIAEEQIHSAADRVALRVAAVDRVIETRKVGEFVLEELLAMDRVAYLRFASVYQEFASPEAFVELLQPLLDKRT